MKKFLIILNLLLLPIFSWGQTIMSIDFSSTALKPGESFKVQVKTSGKFQSGNVFRAELSNKFGDFANVIAIGSISAIEDTTISCIIPDTTPIGNGYRLRVVATKPNFVSSPSNKKIIVYLGKKYFISPNGDDSYKGTPDSTFKTIQKGLDVAWYYDTLIVLPGTYKENLVFPGVDVVLIGLKGPDSTFIDGQKNGRTVITIENGETSATLIDGFTIFNGVNYEMESGAGFTIRFNSSPTLRNLRIRDNEAWAYGGAIYCYNAGTIKIENCIIEGNKAKYLGAGIYTNNTNLELNRCIIRKNNPGGIYNWRSYSNLTNCLVYWNNNFELVNYSDLGIQLKPVILNSTIVSQNKFYGYYLFGRFLAKIYNSIFYSQDSSIAMIGDAYDTLEIANSIIFKYPAGFYRDKAILKLGDKVYSDDPLFVNQNAENFDLDTCSPAIGNALKSISPPVDVFGNPRPISPDDENIPDIGAIESQRNQRSNIVTVTNVSNTKFCKGGTFTLDYSTSGCPFYQGNEFIAELSNPNGTFNPSYELGRVKSTTSGQILCTLPSNLKSSANYRVRVRATNVPYRSEPFPTNIAIFDNPQVKIFGPNKVCSQREYEYWTDSSESPINKWVIKNGYSNNLMTENKIKVIWYDSSSGNIKLVQTNIAGCKDSANINVTILATPAKPSIQQLSDGQLVSSYPSWNQWYFNGSPIQGATSRILKPTKNGYYSVKVIPPNGCESDMSDSIYVIVSSVDSDNQIDVLAFELQGNILRLVRLYDNGQKINFTIGDFVGRELIRGEMLPSVSSVEIDLAGVSNGLFYLVIRSLNKVRVHSFIKIE
jgi:hypothetical protein